jgi:PAS domain S-box-containing protein
MAVGSVGVALGVTLGLGFALQHNPMPLFICAVMASSWFGGFWPGILAGLLSALAINYYFTPPLTALGPIAPQDLPNLMLFAASALFISWLSDEQRRANARLRRTNQELLTEIRVRRLAEDKVRKQAALLSLAHDAIIVRDLQDRIIFWNRGAEDTYGWTASEARGTVTHQLLQTRFPLSLEALSTALREQGEWEGELTHTTRQGTTMVVASRQSLQRDENGAPGAILEINRDVTELKRSLAMQASLAREREMLAQQRAAELAKANEALRECLDALAAVPELDDFLGQVMAAITRQLGASSSALRVTDFERKTMTLELLFQDSRVISPAEARYPDAWRSQALDDRQDAFFLDRPTIVLRTLDPLSPIPQDQRSYLLELGVKTLLMIPLVSGGQIHGRLTFRFTEERDFHPEELEIARALATQASLAIQLTRLAKTARQSAVLEERNRLAGEIHDALAQSFAGISMQLGVAQEELAGEETNALSHLRRANEIAKFGWSEARRSVLRLRSNAVVESGLVTALQRLVERSNVAGRLRCDFRPDPIPEERVPPRVQHELLRIAQEAISNAIRHAKPTVVTVTLRWAAPHLILQVKDNGSGICQTRLRNSEGVGLESMRKRASGIEGKLEIQTAADRGTSIIAIVPISS